MLSPPVSPVCGGQPPVPSPEPVHSLGRTSLARSLTGALSFTVSLFRRVSVCALCQLSFSAELAEKTAALVLDCDDDDYFSAEEVPLSVSLLLFPSQPASLLPRSLLYFGRRAGIHHRRLGRGQRH